MLWITAKSFFVLLLLTACEYDARISRSVQAGWVGSGGIMVEQWMYDPRSKTCFHAYNTHYSNVGVRELPRPGADHRDARCQ